MKIFIAVLVICILAFIALFPMVNTERVCYETSQQNMNVINENVPMRGWTKQSVCERSMDELFSLETCIQDATKSSFIADYVKDIIPRIVLIVRPYSNGVFTQKAAHNAQCAEFDWTLLP